MSVTISDGSMNWRAGLDINEFMSNSSKLQSRVSQLSSKTDKEFSTMEDSFRRAATAATAFFSINTAVGFVNDLVKTRGEFQQLEIAFSTMLGSKEKANQLMAQVTQFAATTPFSLQEVAGSTKQLLAFGIEADKIESTLRSLGDVAAGIGAPIGDIAYLFGTIKTQGVAMTQDVRQFASRGIPIYEQLSKVMHKSTEEVGKLITEGKVGFPEIEKAFQNMTAAGSKFGGLMEAQSHSLTGQIANLKDSWSQMLNDIGRSQEGLLSSGIDALAGLVGNYEKVLDIIGLLVTAYGSYRAALIVTAIHERALTVIQYQRALSGERLSAAQALIAEAEVVWRKGQAALRTELFATQAAVASMTILITALAYGLYSLKQAYDAAHLGESQLNEIRSSANEKLAEERIKIESLVKIARDRNSTKKEEADAIKKLNEINPEYLGALNSQNIATKQGEAAIKSYLKWLDQKLIGEAAYAAKLENIKAKVKLETSGADAMSFTEFTGGVISDVFAGNLFKGNGRQRVVNAGISNYERANKLIDAKFGKQIEDYQKQLNSKSHTPIISSSDTPNKQELKKYEDLLNARLELEGNANDALRSAREKALNEDDLAYAAINDRYEKQLSDIKKFNEKVDKLKLSSDKKQKLHFDTKPIEDARTIELGLKGESDVVSSYEKQIEGKKQLFKDFEDYKAKFGSERAKAEYENQLSGFTSFLEYIDSEIDKKSGSKSRLSTNLKGVLAPFKLDGEKENIQKHLENLKTVLDASETNRIKLKKVDEKYYADLALLRADKALSSIDLEDRERKLSELHQVEIEGFKELAYQESKIYKDLQKDLFFMTRDRLKEHLKDLKADLKNQGLTPSQIEHLNQSISSTESLIRTSSNLSKISVRVAEYGQAAAGSFHEIGTAMEGINDDLAFTLHQLGDLAGLVSNLASSIASGNPIKIASSVISSVAGLFSMGKKVKEMNRQAREEVQKYYDTAIAGELEYQAMIRARAREIATQNPSTLSGLSSQRQLIKQQTSEIDRQVQAILLKLQGEQYIASETYKHGTWFRKAKTIQNLSSLSGMNFDQLEKLYTEGKLTDGAKALFEQLQKLKNEGADVTQTLADMANEASQIFTGTTAESITDMIVQGFGDGLRSVQDFGSKMEDIINGSLLNALKYQAIEGPIKKLYEQFALDAESGGILDLAEIANFRTGFNTVIKNAADFVDMLQKTTGVDLSAATAMAGNKQRTLTDSYHGEVIETRNTLLFLK